MQFKLNEIKWARKLKYRHLEVFLTIVDARSLTGAAAELNMTQSAVSHWLIEIENLIGAPLCERGRGHFSLTPTGDLFRLHAERMIGEIRRTHLDIETLASGASGRLHIGSILSAAPALLPRTIANFQKAQPGVFLTVSEATLDVLQERLELRELDLIIAPLDLRLYKTHLSSELLIDDSLRIVARKGHPLTLKKRPPWDAAATYRWILPPPGTLMRQCIEQAFMNQGLAIPQAGIETASIITIQTLLQETDYLTVMSRSVAQHYQNVGILDSIDLAPEMKFARLGMVWVTENNNALLAKFRTALMGESIKLRKQPD